MFFLLGEEVLRPVGAGIQRRALFLQVPHFLLHIRHAPQLIANIRIAGGGKVIYVLKLTAVKRHINGCIVIFSLDNISVITQHFTRSL